MAYAFTQAGFAAHDVHMSDLQAGRADLKDYAGLVACGGFSYGDTLGAGIGWARSITFNDRLAAQFQAFFGRVDTFGLGVCNGCQMFAELAQIIPGAQDWPRFTTNQSERFEARLSMVEVLDSPSVFLQGMAGARLPIAVAHGEGFANFSQRGNAARVLREKRNVMLLVGGAALREGAQKQLQRIASKTGCRLLAEGSNARIQRGRGRLGRPAGRARRGLVPGAAGRQEIPAGLRARHAGALARDELLLLVLHSYSYSYYCCLVLVLPN
jgi:hypothetical protein